MKIINIQPQLTQKYNINNYQTKPQKQIQEQSKYDKLPTTQQYLAFTGGYSLDLAQTVKQLDKLAEKNSGIYPPNIREWLGMALEEGSKKTLIGVHKDYFSSLKKDFITLDEIKVNFKELFEKVVPASSVKAQEGSFIDKFQKGELEFFDNDEDLSIQLIKLYWGEGFSLNDLKRYTGGLDLYHTMTKLQIPRVSKEYGHILKFSDPQYNERLTKEMTLKRLESMDRKAQLENGDPVYIPSGKRGPLSEEHKKHISEGQIRHWQEHPEKIYEMSERQKQYYIDNPERIEDFKRVLNKAWNIFGADNIKKAMSQFFKTKKVEIFDLSNPLEMNSKQTKTLKEFWGQNEWAKKSFSKNMKHAWKKIKEENEKFYEVDLTPNSFKEKFYEWAKEKGLDLSNLDFKFKIYKFRPQKDEGHGVELSKYTPHFIDEYSDKIDADMSRMLANTYCLSLINISKELKKIVASPKLSQQTKSDIETIRIFIKNSLFKPGIGLNREIKTLDAQEAQNIYRNTILMSLMTPNPDKSLSLFNKHLNDSFDFICTQPNKPVILTEEMLLGVLK